MAEYTSETKKSLSEIFHKCDSGHKGYLKQEDLKVAMINIFGYKPTKHEIEEIFLHGQESNSNRINIQMFGELMSRKMSTVDEDDEIRQIFLAFDNHCNGFLTVCDVKKVFSSFAPHLPGHRVEAAFREIDRDGDGRVSYKDFEFMMKYNHDIGV